VRTRLLPYRLPFFDYARKLDASSNGRLRLAVQLVAAYPDVRVDDIQLRLEAGDEELPIEVAKNGVFVVPVVDRMARHDAQFSINKRRGALRANAMLWPTIARNQWTMRSVRQVAADAGAAIAPLGAWYMTPLLSIAKREHRVSVCGATAGATVKIVQDGAEVAALPMDMKARLLAEQPVFCHAFTGQERYRDSARVVLPEGGQVLIL
jgi:hypothetical protein